MKASTIVLVIFGFLLFLLCWHGSKAALGPTKQGNATNTASDLLNCISAYFTEYRRFPGIAAESSQGFADFRTDRDFMRYLLGETNRELELHRSPRGIAFFTGKNARFNSKTQKWVDGMVFDSDSRAELFDPWGQHYRIRIVLDQSRAFEGLSIPEGYKVGGDLVLVWSAGKDGDYKTWKDNLVSWTTKK